jgi:hypothetical protein
MNELPADLAQVLADPGIIVAQDAAVFELIGKSIFSNAEPAHCATGPCRCRRCRDLAT